MEKGIYFTLAGKDYFLHDSVFQGMVIAFILSICAIVINSKIKKADYRKKSTGIINLLEIYVEAFQSLVDQTMGKGHRKFVSYVCTLMLYLVFANLWGLLGFTTPTSDYNVTVSLAIMTFVLVQATSIVSNGIGGYLKGFLEPFPLFLPMNIIGEIANPISLSFRLFGNILGGVIIMELVHSALQSISVFLVPASAVLHIYFDVFSGLLQAFIFTMLTMAFIGQTFPEE